MAKEHTIMCGITRVPRVYVRRGDARYRQNAAVVVGGIQVGEVYERNGSWMAANTVNTRVKPTTHKTAQAAVKSVVCGQVRSERTSRKLPY